MFIYTYYNDLNFVEQEHLLETWIVNWKNRGFKPVVLRLEHAKSCSYYEEFYNKILKLYENITNQTLKKYGMACYLRWLAYSALDIKEPFLMSDYDIINYNFSLDDANEQITNKLTFLDRYCPCFALGTSEQVLCFVKQIINFLENNKPSLQHFYHKYELQTLHDQDFLWLAHKIQPYFNHYDKNEFLSTPLNINIPKTSSVCLYDHKNISSCVKLYHISTDSAVSFRLANYNLQKFSNGYIKNFIAKNILTNNE